MTEKQSIPPASSNLATCEAEIGEITRFLHEWEKGDRDALDEIMPKVIADLRRIAHQQYTQSRGHGADRPTELIGLVWERLNQLKSIPRFENSKQFYAYCARIIKNLLRDKIRFNRAKRREGELIELDEFVDLSFLRDDRAVSPEDRVIVFDLLDRLEQEIKESYDVFVYKKILGFKDLETAKILGISVATLQIRYSFAKAWLYKELNIPKPD